jgi:hypothetical protein
MPRHCNLPDCDASGYPDTCELDPNTDTNANQVLDSCEIPFLRGDCGANGGVDLADAVAILGQVFGSAAPPTCLAACDFTADGSVNLVDAVALLGALFGTQPHPLPAVCALGPGGIPPSCAAYLTCP